jgi:tetratricopeptide (TPR) repeat protein
MMGTTRAILLLALALGGCAGRGPRPPAPFPGGDAAEELARADELARAGRETSAREVYRQILRDEPASPAAAEAYYALGLLYADPASGVHDWRRAQATFERLLAEHPASARAREARAWRAALGALLRRDGELTAIRRDLDRLKEVDRELERPR